MHAFGEHEVRGASHVDAPVDVQVSLARPAITMKESFDEGTSANPLVGAPRRLSVLAAPVRAKPLVGGDDVISQPCESFI
jgi:hypothetical protein